MKRIFATAVTGLAIAFGASTVAAPAAAAFPIIGSENLYTAEADIFNQINAIRAQHGMSQLPWNQYLADISRSWSQTSAARDHLAHDPMALQLADMENVAVMYNNPRDAVNGWMNSPTHRANILNPYAQSLGIGVAKNHATGGYFVTMRGNY